jgi:cytochrome c-type biogenesis protein CcmH/NrfF
MAPNQARIFGHRSAVKRLLATGITLLCALLLLGAGADPARFNSLGHKMICACGCNQILLECNHVGCPLSDGMRNELAAALGRGDSNDLVLQAFVQKYGPTVLAAPTTTGFNRVAWIMPFAVLLAGFLLAVGLVHRWRSKPVAALAANGDEAHLDDFRDQVRKDTRS